MFCRILIAKTLKYMRGEYPNMSESLTNLAICSQYSAQLQLEILGVSEPKNLITPVLDIGCGEDGTLVKYLSRLDLEVYGIDKNAEPITNINNTDWFDMNFELESWGTIISHMAFSLHFINHHLRIDGDPAKFASFYMRILNALKIGGRFIYAPGLPFIEKFLPPSRFIIIKKKVNLENINKICDDLLMKNESVKDYFYSAQIIRISGK